MKIFIQSPTRRSQKVLQFILYGILGVAFCAVIIVRLRQIIDGLSPELTYRKDLLQDYLMASALRFGLNPYAPLPELKQAIIGTADSQPIFPHPTPHTPLSILLFYPFTSFSFPVAAAVWCCLEILLLGWTLLLLRQLFIPELSQKWLVPILLLLTVSDPVSQDLIVGQLSIVLLWCVTIILLLLGQKRSILAGLVLGFCFALKLTGWPLLIFFVVRRNVHTIVATIFSFALIGIVTLFFVGSEWTNQYVTQVAPQASELYARDEYNQSVFTLGDRIFRGLALGPQRSVSAPPLYRSEELSRITDIIVLVGIVMLTVCISRNMPTDEHAIIVLLGLSTIASPICWSHAFVMFLPAIFFCFKKLNENNYPEPYTLWGVVLLVFMFFVQLPRDIIIGDKEVVSFSIGWISYFGGIVAVASVFYTYTLGRRLSRECA